jgi:hypothetical protein
VAIAIPITLGACLLPESEPRKNHRVMMSLTRAGVTEMSDDYAKHYPADVQSYMASALAAGASRDDVTRGVGRVAARYGVSDWTLTAPQNTDGRSRRVEFVLAVKNIENAYVSHVGLRIDDSLYHFRSLTSADLLVGSRYRWVDFVERYCVFGNQRIEIDRLPVSDEAAQLIEDRLKRLNSIQEKHFDRLDALQLESRWLTALGDSGETPPDIGGLGYFQAGDIDSAGEALRLRAKLESEMGKRFIPQALAGVTAEVQRIALQVSEPGTDTILPDQYPRVSEIAAERLRDFLTLREALLVLDQGRGLAESGIRKPCGDQLTARERAKLEAFSSRIADSIVRLLRSTRPDRGQPILIASARYLAIQRSLQLNRFALLDRLSDEVSVIDRSDSRWKNELIDSLTNRSRDEWQALRAETFAGQGQLDEFRFGLLEMAGTRYAELAAAEQRGWVRTGSLQGLPGRAGAATLPPLELDRSQLAAAQARSRSVSASYKTALHKTHEFATLSHNCCTEITKAIRSAFPDDAAASAALGGETIPSKGLAVIPKVLAHKVRHRWTVSESRIISARGNSEKLRNEHK